MSRDIRSYFTSLSKKPASSAATPNTKKKKRPIIIDSDDEDIIQGTPEPVKKRKLDISAKPKHKPVNVIVSDSDDEGEAEKSKRTVNPKDVFGTAPVKQSKSENEKKRESDFKKTLEQLDEDFDIDLGELDKTIDEAVHAPEDAGVNADEERYERRRHSAMLYQKYLHRGGPSHKGSKELPKGKADCLRNLCFMHTGVLDSLEKEDFQNIVKEHGGRTVSAVSRKVNYLVVGEDPGPVKLEKARNLGIKQISEDELLDMILVRSGMKPMYVKRDGDEGDNGKHDENTTREVTRSRSRSRERKNDESKGNERDKARKKSSEDSKSNEREERKKIKSSEEAKSKHKSSEESKRNEKNERKKSSEESRSSEREERRKSSQELKCNERKKSSDESKTDRKKDGSKTEKRDLNFETQNPKERRDEKDERQHEKDERRLEKDERKHEKDERKHEKDERKLENDERKHEKDERKHEKDERKLEKDERKPEKDERRHKNDERKHEKDERKFEKEERKHEKEERKHEKEERKHENSNRKSDKPEKEQRKSGNDKTNISDDKEDMKNRKMNIGTKYANAIKEEIRQIKEGAAPTTSSHKKETPKAQQPKETPQSNLSWTEKYKPLNLKSIIGQQGDKSNMSKLLHWLKNWYRNQSPHNKAKLARPSPWAKNDDGAFFKCALLSGPPGVGKTTTATLVARELQFDVVEFNASDTRSKKFLHEQVAQMLKTKSVASYFKEDGGAPTSKHVLLMDEVDGMAGNEDRGGIQELINLIKNTKIPIICMCNDRQHQKMRSLVNYCYDLRFSKPRVEQIKGAMMSICFKEGVKISPDALTELIGNSGSDIRQTLNNLSMWSSGDKNLSSDLVKKESAAAIKDTVLGPWEVIRKVFSQEEHKTMSLPDRSRLFFYDYSIGPLFVQENYLQVAPHCPKSEILERVAKAADSISMGDVIDKKIRSTNNWSLLESQAFYSSVIPGHYMEGHFAGQINFPGWLGKNSKRTKFNRLLGELQAHMRTAASSSKASVNLDYIYHLRDRIVGPLVKEGAGGVEKSLGVMRAYHLMREDLDSILELAQWPKRKDPMAMVDSKVKAAFTRAYNKEGVTLPYSVTSAAVKKSTRNAEAADDIYGDEEAVSDDGDDDDITKDAMIKEKKPTKAAASKKAPAKKTSARGGRGGKKGK